MMEAEATKIVIAKPVASRPSFSIPKISSKLVGSCPENAVAVIKPETVRLRPNCNVPLLPTNKSTLSSDVVLKPIAKLVVAAADNLNNQGKQGTNPTSHSSQVEYQTQTEGNNDTVQILVDGSKSLVHHNKHTWRKYGQKQVKGKEYPRSYYKWTYPNCTMRKRVERSVDGQLEESAYQAKHKRATSQLLPQELSLSRSNARLAGDAVFTSHAGSSDSKTSVALAVGSEMENGDGLGGGITLPNRLDHANKYSAEPKWNPVGDINDSVVEGDKFGWRKYGQNVMKKNPYSRSYYRCTYAKCSARKYIERSIDNPQTFITIYEGSHDHGTKGTNWDLLRDNLPASDIGSVNEANPILQ